MLRSAAIHLESDRRSAQQLQVAARREVFAKQPCGKEKQGSSGKSFSFSWQEGSQLWAGADCGSKHSLLAPEITQGLANFGEETRPTHSHTHAHTHTHIHRGTRTRTRARTHARTHTGTHARTRTCTRTCTRTHTHTHTDTHILPHTSTQSNKK